MLISNQRYIPQDSSRCQSEILGDNIRDGVEDKEVVGVIYL